MKYKLNITKKTDNWTYLNDQIICNESIEYIESFPSFEKAYEECDNPYWLTELLLLIELYDNPYWLTELLLLIELYDNKHIINYILCKKGNNDIINYFKLLSDKGRNEFENRLINSYIRNFKEKFPWSMIENKLIEKKIIIPIKKPTYKLNILHRYNDCVSIGNIYKPNYICYDALNYITDSKSLKQAYEQCTNASWISELSYILNFEIEAYEYRQIKIKRYGERKFHKLHYSEQSLFLKKWDLSYIKYFKEKLPWRKLFKLLVKNEIIVKE